MTVLFSASENEGRNERAKIYRVALLSLGLLGGLVGHQGGDFLVQTDTMAGCKQQHTGAGRLALARHAASYAATQAATNDLMRSSGDGVEGGWRQGRGCPPDSHSTSPSMK